ncbi:MAG: polysaccharide biosynthesis C-terminal domain-containing protein [Bulleidia sp.]
MRILVTGANGFVGKNLCANLQAIMDGYDHTHPRLSIEAIYRYDKENTPEELETWCKNADFVFHLAGVNRPRTDAEFMAGNFGFSSKLLETLRKYDNRCPVMLASSIQASLIGRYGESAYGKSKLAGEELFAVYGEETGSKVLIYRFPNLFGKWSRPHYNSVIATFCYNISRDLPIAVDDEAAKMELLYIDDLVQEMIGILSGEEHRCTYDGLRPVEDADGKFCYVPCTHHVSLGEVVDLLHAFHDQPASLILPAMPAASFARKLFSTYLSYLPAGKAVYDLPGHEDARGGFTELLKMPFHGQVSVNVSKPGVTKGEHWHNTKWEIFMVLKGRARIEERRLDSDEVLSFEVSGDHLQAVYMLPGYTHAITNLSASEDLITLIYANEIFDTHNPDTVHAEVRL